MTVAYATSLRPFDAVGLAEIVGGRPVVVSVEPFYEGSAAPILTPALARLPVRFTSVGGPREFIHGYGTLSDLDEAVGLDAAGIRRRLAEHLDA